MNTQHSFYNRFLGVIAFWGLFAHAVAAQNIAVSEPYTLQTREDYMMIGRSGDTTLALLYEENSFRLMQFDANLKTHFTEKIQPERYNIDILKTVLDKQFCTVLYRFSGGGRSSLKAVRISTQGELLDSMTLQSTTQWGVVYQPKLVVSDDRSKLLAYDLTENNTVFNSLVFDLKAFKPLWNRQFRPSNMDYNNSLNAALIDNAGGVYWAIERDNRRAKLLNNRFEIIYYTPELSQEWSVLVPIPNRFWQKIAFVFDNKNKKLIGAGYCSVRKAARVESIFYFNITPLFQDIANVFFSDFEPNFVQQITGKVQTPNTLGFTDFELRELLLRNDGGVVMVGEYFKKTVRYSASPSMMQRGSFGGGYPMDTRSTTDYEFNDIMLVSVLPNGQKNWNVILPKRQTSDDDDGLFSSFYMMKTKLGIRFIYNDAIKNSGNVNEYLMQTDGSAQRRSLFNNQKQDVEVIPTEAFQFSANGVMLPSLARNRLRMVELQY